MWIMKCCPPLIPIIETDISNDIFIPNNRNIKLPIIPETNIDLLKNKIICDILGVVIKILYTILVLVLAWFIFWDRYPL